MHTGSMSLSREDFRRVREELVALIQRTGETATDSPAEELLYLNLDWIKVCRSFDYP